MNNGSGVLGVNVSGGLATLTGGYTTHTYTGGTTVTGGSLALFTNTDWSGAVLSGTATVQPGGTMMSAGSGNSAFGYGGSYGGISTLYLNGGLLYNGGTKDQLFPGTLYMAGGTLGGATNGWSLEHSTTPGGNIVVSASTVTAYINNLSGNDGVGAVNVVGGSAPGGVDLQITGVLDRRRDREDRRRPHAADGHKRQQHPGESERLGDYAGTVAGAGTYA